MVTNITLTFSHSNLVLIVDLSTFSCNLDRKNRAEKVVRKKKYSKKKEEKRKEKEEEEGRRRRLLIIVWKISTGQSTACIKNVVIILVNKILTLAEQTLILHCENTAAASGT